MKLYLLYLWTGGGSSQSLSLTLTHLHRNMRTHTALSGPTGLDHHTPPQDHLNGTNPDCCKSSRVHAENGVWGAKEEGR